MRFLKAHKELKNLKRLFEAYCTIVHEVDERGNDIMCPHLEFSNNLDTCIKKLDEVFNLFDLGYIVDPLGVSQVHYCMLVSLPRQKWLLKSINVEYRNKQ